jgi:hypothetical protein
MEKGKDQRRYSHFGRPFRLQLPRSLKLALMLLLLVGIVRLLAACVSSGVLVPGIFGSAGLRSTTKITCLSDGCKASLYVPVVRLWIASVFFVAQPLVRCV